MMTKVEALSIVSNYIDKADWMPEEHKDAMFVARELCFIDLVSTDVEEWFSWTAEQITIMFYDLALTSIEDFADDVKAEEASSNLIKDTLDIETLTTDRDSAALGIKRGAAGMFIALGAYIAVREEVKKKFYENY